MQAIKSWLERGGVREVRLESTTAKRQNGSGPFYKNQDACEKSVPFGLVGRAGGARCTLRTRTPYGIDGATKAATARRYRRVGSGGEIEVGKFFLPSPFKEPCVVANLDLLALGSG